jgi:hypothetical protein
MILTACIENRILHETDAGNVEACAPSTGTSTVLYQATG